MTDRQADHIEDTSGATDQGRELVPPISLIWCCHVHNAIKHNLDRLEATILTETSIGRLAEIKELLSQAFDPADPDLNEELSSLIDMCNTRLHMLAYGPVSSTSSTSSGEAEA